LSYPDDASMPHLEDIYASPSEGIFTDLSYNDEGVFQIQKEWILVDLSFVKKEIGTKWVYKNKKDEMGVVVRNKAQLVAQGHRQEEGIDYDEVFALVAGIEAIMIFLAFDSYMGFIVYQMDVKSAFLYGTIDKEVYVSQPPSFIDPKFPNKVCKVVKALYVENQANKSEGPKEANNSAGTQANDDQSANSEEIVIFMKNILYGLYGLLTQLLSRAQETRLKRTSISRHVRSQLVK
nr:copia protein [Tanacetum cinerariifolium]